MSDFLDLLEAYHHWCVRGDGSRLEQCKAWLAAITPVPTDEMGWHRLGTGGLDWLVPLPSGWELHWRMLSSREMTLTVEALEYLESRRPGAVAAAFPHASGFLPRASKLYIPAIDLSQSGFANLLRATTFARTLR